MNNNHETKRADILNAALKLFSSRGYDGTGISDIMAVSKTAKGTVYHFFSSKEEIYREIWNTYFPQLYTAVGNAAVYIPRPEDYEHDVFPVLVSVMKTFFSFAQQNTDFYRLLLSSVFIPPDATCAAISANCHAKLLEQMHALFSAMSKAHGNMKRKENQIADSFYAIVNSRIAKHLAGGTALTDKNAELIVRQFMHGIFS